MKYADLTDKQLIKLAKLRLMNEEFLIINLKPIRVSMIYIEKKRLNPLSDEFVVSFIIKTKKFSDERRVILFKKFYPNEFKFLEKCGIKF